MYGVLIWSHAATATVALVAAFGSRDRRWFGVYHVAMWAMVGFLVAAVAVDVGGRDLARHLVTAALVVLAAVMVWRAELARRTRITDPPRFVGHVGFTIVGLIDAFVVVTVVNSGAPGWLTATVGVLIAVAGHLVIHAVRDRAAAKDRPDLQHISS